MAEAILSSVLEKLATVAVQEGVELYKVHKKIEPMKSNLEMIQGFLRDAESNQNKSESGKVWVNQVRELAYRTEIAVDRFMVEIEENRKSRPGVFSNLKNAMKHPIKLHTINSEFKAIEKEMKRIYDTRNQLGITELGSGRTTEVGSGSKEDVQPHFRPSKPFHIIDSQVVGFDADKHKIISNLLDENISRRMVLSIVGVGGLGKTTLAQKIYKSAEVSREFSCRAWVSISQQFDTNKVIREILYSVEPEMEEKHLSDDKVWEQLVESLNDKRYLIILDDVWTNDLWNTLQLALPDTGNKSRVVITTRIFDVASAADRNTEPYKLDYLNEDESLTLLFRKALQQDIQPNKYPSNLVEVAKVFIKKCGRLPLALVVLGGMLSTKPDTCIAWTKVNETFYWHSKHGKGCMETLRMSYLELSFNHRQCFQYFAAFPEDHEIDPKALKRMWIAEGLIPVNGNGTMEDLADEYLEDLIKRSLVQVVQKSWDDSIVYCGMHDLLRDLAIHEAKEANFFSVFSKHEDCSELAIKEAHRVALQFPSPTGYIINHSKNIRSLLRFGGSLPNYQGFTQLRVLVIKSCNFEEMELGGNWLEGLIHMKYLGFINCEISGEVIYNIPFNSMNNLETFHCDNIIQTKEISNASWSSWSLWEVPTLRHVTFRCYPCVPGPLKWDNLKNVHTLEGVLVESIPQLESNLNLYSLWIRLDKQLVYPEDNWNALQALLSRTKHLVSLAIINDKGISFPAVGMMELPCYETIQWLLLYGPWAEECVLSIGMFPKYLTVLYIQEFDREEDPMPILERLQYLTILVLSSFHKVNKMVCSREGFPSLQKLYLEQISITELEIQEGSMPFLSQLKLQYCRDLDTLPELQKVPRLQELIVTGHSAKMDRRLQSEDLYKIKHIPLVRITNPRSDYNDVYASDNYDDDSDNDEGDYDDDDNEGDGEYDDDDDDSGDDDNDDDDDGGDEDDDDDDDVDNA